MLGLIREKLTALGVKFEYFDGSTAAPDREKQYKVFKTMMKSGCFLSR